MIEEDDVDGAGVEGLFSVTVSFDIFVGVAEGIGSESEAVVAEIEAIVFAKFTDYGYWAFLVISDTPVGKGVG